MRAAALVAPLLALTLAGACGDDDAVPREDPLSATTTPTVPVTRPLPPESERLRDTALVFPPGFRVAMEHGESVTLFVLDGQQADALLIDPPRRSGARKRRAPVFHDNGIVDSARLLHAQYRGSLVDLLADDISASSGVPDFCVFTPHRGFRAVHDGVRYDAVFCFDCGEISMSRDDVETSGTLSSCARQAIVNLYESHGLYVRPDIDESDDDDYRSTIGQGFTPELVDSLTK